MNKLLPALLFLSLMLSLNSFCDVPQPPDAKDTTGSYQLPPKGTPGHWYLLTTCNFPGAGQTYSGDSRQDGYTWASKRTCEDAWETDGRVDIHKYCQHQCLCDKTGPCLEDEGGSAGSGSGGSHNSNSLPGMAHDMGQAQADETNKQVEDAKNGLGGLSQERDKNRPDFNSMNDTKKGAWADDSDRPTAGRQQKPSQDENKTEMPKVTIPDFNQAGGPF